MLFVKPTSLIFTIRLLSLIWLTSPIYAELNLIEDGGFEDKENITAWYRDAYRNSEETVRFSITNELKAGGTHSLAIMNLVPNDSKVMQSVKVKPGTWYRLSCRILAQDIKTERLGACLGIMGCIKSSPDFKETHGRWEEAAITGKTGWGQYSLTVTLRVGFFSSLAQGRAYFDEVRMEELAKPPAVTDPFDFSCMMHDETVLNPLNQRQLKTQYAVLQALLVLLGSIVAMTVLLVVVLFLTRRKKLRMFEADPQSLTPAPHLIEKQLKIRVKQILPDEAVKEYILKSLYITRQKIFIQADELAAFKKGQELELVIDHKQQKYNLGKGIIRRIKAGTATTLGGFELEFKNKSSARFAKLKELLFLD